MSDPTPTTPNCPVCGKPPFLLLSNGEQAFCGTEECTVLIWNQHKTVDELLMNASFHDFQ